MLLFIIRHGDPTYSPDALTPLGKRQAEAVGRRLARHGIDEIYTSPLIRARETAQPLCEMLHKEPIVADWASEGFAWEYFTFIDENWENRQNWVFGIQNTIFKTPENIKLNDNWMDAYPFNKSKAKEGWEILKKNSDAFMSSQGYDREGLFYRVREKNEKRVAVFCHQGFGTTWLSYLLSVSPPLFWSSFDITHSGVTVLKLGTSVGGLTGVGVISISDMSHIYESRLPMKFANGIEL